MTEGEQLSTHSDQPKSSRLSPILKWVGGILTAVLLAVMIYFIEHTPFMEVSVVRSDTGSPKRFSRTPPNGETDDFYTGDDTVNYDINVRNSGQVEFVDCIPSVSNLPHNYVAQGQYPAPQSSDIEPGKTAEWKLPYDLFSIDERQRTAVDLSCFWYDIFQHRHQLYYREVRIIGTPSIDRALGDAHYLSSKHVADPHQTGELLAKLDQAKAHEGPERLKLLIESREIMESKSLGGDAEENRQLAQEIRLLERRERTRLGL